jgi:AraC-like DNA-binding protein
MLNVRPQSLASQLPQVFCQPQRRAFSVALCGMQRSKLQLAYSRLPRLFRRRVGISPKAFRDRLKAEQ